MKRFIQISILSMILIPFQSSGQCGDNHLMGGKHKEATTMEDKQKNNTHKIHKTEDEWKEQLSEKAYQVLRGKGTEMAFTGKYYKYKENGAYLCAACGAELFTSEDKYDSGSGWPSFVKPIRNENVGEKSDTRYGMKRTEVHCAKCGGHLGHVFTDGPGTDGLRYCINSVSLEFRKKD